MAKVATSNRESRQPQRPEAPRRRRHGWGAALFLLIVIALAVAVTLERLPHPVQHVVVTPQVTPTFVPHVGDVSDADDKDDGITIATGPVPGFQFQSGGYTLDGITLDAQTHKPVGGVFIWVTLPPVQGQRTAPTLRTVSTLAGSFSFVHLATGSYTLAAARYSVQPGQPLYPEVTLTHVRVPSHTTLRFLLTPQNAPANRHPVQGVAHNVILLDMSGIYAESWFDDPALQLATQNVRSLAASGASATSVTAPYGWHPADQYALLSGTYPSWRVYDTWPQLNTWGQPDSIDTTFWYNSVPSAMDSGQESLFDVARAYGMSTAALGGPDYLLNDVSTRNVQTAQVGLVFDGASWLQAAQHLITTMKSNSNGFIFYGELDPSFGAAGAAGASPDAAGGAYARAMQADDTVIGLLRSWLAQQGLLANTAIVLTASEAQVNETLYDNYYGMGPSGRGSSLDVPLILSGPGIVAGMVEQRPLSSFSVAATALRTLCLPAPANARMGAVTSLFRNSC